MSLAERTELPSRSSPPQVGKTLRGAQAAGSDVDHVRRGSIDAVLATRHAGGRLVSMLEGGYNLEALAECAVAHVGALRD